jgi:hypothetical protein
MSEKPADEGDHDHEDESEWDITLNGPRLALQATAAQEGKVTFGTAVRESSRPGRQRSGDPWRLAASKNSSRPAEVHW